MFFKALNPISKKSGILYSLSSVESLQGKEMIDRTVDEQVKEMNNKPIQWVSVKSNPGGVIIGFDFFNDITELLMGNHYDMDLRGEGSKGLLDFLILPLLARKLIADCYLPERETTFIRNTVALVIALPLECIRLGMGYGLSTALILTVAIGYLAKLLTELLFGFCAKDEDARLSRAP